MGNDGITLARISQKKPRAATRYLSYNRYVVYIADDE